MKGTSAIDAGGQAWTRLVRAWSGAFMLVLALALALPLRAAEVDADRARQYVEGWLTAADRPLGTNLDGSTIGAVTPLQSGSDLLGYVVALQPKGFVVVSADDRIDPLIAVSDQGSYAANPANPLQALLLNSLSARLAAARQQAPEAVAGRSGAPSATAEPETVTANRLAWNRFAPTGTPSGRSGSAGTNVVSEKWVDRFTFTNWSQGDGIYNYYTPLIHASSYEFDPGNPANLVSGCVATAGAQILRYFQWPQGRLNNVTGDFTAVFRDESSTPNGVWVPNVRLRGGDGLGGPYDWAKMSYTPSTSDPLESIQQIGALCFDAGLAAGMTYNIENSNMSGAGGVSFGKFQYTSGSAADIRAALDARRPVPLSNNWTLLEPGALGGHAIYADGYGRLDGRWYYHVNFGWGAGSNLWFNWDEQNLLGVDSWGPGSGSQVLYRRALQQNEMVTGAVYSGRVTDANGNPVAGVKVRLQRLDEDPLSLTFNTFVDWQEMLAWYDPVPGSAADPASQAYVVPAGQPVGDYYRNYTDANGIWAIDKVHPAGIYQIVLEHPDLPMQFAGVKNITGASRWGINFIASPMPNLALDAWWIDGDFLVLDFNRAVGGVLFDLSQITLDGTPLNFLPIYFSPACDRVIIDISGVTLADPAIATLAIQPGFMLIDVDDEGDQPGVNDVPPVPVAPTVSSNTQNLQAPDPSFPELTSITRAGDFRQRAGRVAFNVAGSDLNLITLRDFAVRVEASYNGPDGTYPARRGAALPPVSLHSWDAGTGELTLNVGTGTGFVRVDYVPAAGNPFITGQSILVDNLGPMIVEARLSADNQFVDLLWNEPAGGSADVTELPGQPMNVGPGGKRLLAYAGTPGNDDWFVWQEARNNVADNFYNLNDYAVDVMMAGNPPAPGTPRGGDLDGVYISVFGFPIENPIARYMWVDLNNDGVFDQNDGFFLKFCDEIQEDRLTDAASSQTYTAEFNSESALDKAFWYGPGPMPSDSGFSGQTTWPAALLGAAGGRPLAFDGAALPVFPLSGSSDYAAMQIAYRAWFASKAIWIDYGQPTDDGYQHGIDTIILGARPTPDPVGHTPVPDTYLYIDADGTGTLSAGDCVWNDLTANGMLQLNAPGDLDVILSTRVGRDALTWKEPFAFHAMTVSLWANGGTVTAVTITDVLDGNGNPLAAAATLTRLALAYTPPLQVAYAAESSFRVPAGVEQIEIKAVANAIFDALGNAAPAACTSGLLKLHSSNLPCVSQMIVGYDNLSLKIVFSKRIFGNNEGLTNFAEMLAGNRRPIDILGPQNFTIVAIDQNNDEYQLTLGSESVVYDIGTNFCHINLISNANDDNMKYLSPHSLQSTSNFLPKEIRVEFNGIYDLDGNLLLDPTYVVPLRTPYKPAYAGLLPPMFTNLGGGYTYVAPDTSAPVVIQTTPPHTLQRALPVFNNPDLVNGESLVVDRSSEDTNYVEYGVWYRDLDGDGRIDAVDLHFHNPFWTSSDASRNATLKMGANMAQNFTVWVQTSDPEDRDFADQQYFPPDAEGLPTFNNVGFANYPLYNTTADSQIYNFVTNAPPEKFNQNWTKVTVTDCTIVAQNVALYTEKNRFSVVRLTLNQSNLPVRTGSDRYVMVAYVAPRAFSSSTTYNKKIHSGPNKVKKPSGTTWVDDPLYDTDDEDAQIYWFVDRNNFGLDLTTDTGKSYANGYFMVDSFGPVVAWDGAPPVPVSAVAWRNTPYVKQNETGFSHYEYLDVTFSEPLAYVSDHVLANAGWSSHESKHGYLLGAWGAEVIRTGSPATTVRFRFQDNTQLNRSWALNTNLQTHQEFERSGNGRIYDLSGSFTGAGSLTIYSNTLGTARQNRSLNAYSASGTAIGVKMLDARYQVLGPNDPIDLLEVNAEGASVTRNGFNGTSTDALRVKTVDLRTYSQGGGFNFNTANWVLNGGSSLGAAGSLTHSPNTAALLTYGVRLGTPVPGSAFYGGITNISIGNDDISGTGEKLSTPNTINYFAPTPLAYTMGQKTALTPPSAVLSGPVYVMARARSRSKSNTSRLAVNESVPVLDLDLVGSSSYRLTDLKVRVVDTSLGQFDPITDLMPVNESGESGLRVTDPAGIVIPFASGGYEWSAWKRTAAGLLYRDITLRFLNSIVLPTQYDAASPFTLWLTTSSNFNLGDSFYVEVPADGGIAFGAVTTQTETAKAETWATANGTRGYPLTDYRYRDVNTDNRWSFGEAITSWEDPVSPVPFYDGGLPYTTNQQNKNVLDGVGNAVRNLYYAKKNRALNPESYPIGGVSGITNANTVHQRYFVSGLDLNYNVAYLPGDDVWYDVGGELGVYDQGIDIPLTGSAHAFVLPYAFLQSGARSANYRGAAAATAASASLNRTVSAPTEQPAAMVGLSMQDSGRGFGPRLILGGAVSIDSISKNIAGGVYESKIVYAASAGTIRWQDGAPVLLPASPGTYAIAEASDGTFIVFRRLNDIALPALDETISLTVNSGAIDLDRSIKQPEKIAGVRIHAVGRSNTIGVAKTLTYSATATTRTLQWGTGATVDVSAGGLFVLNPAADYLMVEVTQAGLHDHTVLTEDLTVYAANGRPVTPFLHISGLEIMAVSDMVEQGFYRFSFDGVANLSWGNGAPTDVTSGLTLVPGDPAGNGYVIVRRTAAPLPGAVTDTLFINQTRLLRVDVRITDLGGVTNNHFNPLSNDENSGIALYWDANANGTFEPGLDVFVPLQSTPVLAGSAGVYTTTLYPDPAALYAWLACPQVSGSTASNFFVCVRTTGDMSYGDRFSVRATFYEPTEPNLTGAGVATIGDSGTITCTSVTNTYYAKMTRSGQRIDAGSRVPLASIDHFLGADTGSKVYVNEIILDLVNVDGFDPANALLPLTAETADGARGIVLYSNTDTANTGWSTADTVIPCTIVSENPEPGRWTYHLKITASDALNEVPFDQNGRPELFVILNFAKTLPYGVSLYAHMGVDGVLYSTGVGSAASELNTDTLSSTIASAYSELLPARVLGAATGLTLRSAGSAAANGVHGVRLSYDPITDSWYLNWNGQTALVDMSQVATYTLGTGNDTVTLTFNPAAFRREDTLLTAGMPGPSAASFPGNLALGTGLCRDDDSRTFWSADRTGAYDALFDVLLIEDSGAFYLDAATEAARLDQVPPGAAFYDRNGNGLYDEGEMLVDAFGFRVAGEYADESLAVTVPASDDVRIVNIGIGVLYFHRQAPRPNAAEGETESWILLADTLVPGSRLAHLQGNPAQGEIGYYDTNANGRFDEGETVAFRSPFVPGGEINLLGELPVAPMPLTPFAAADRLSFWDANGNGAYDAAEPVLRDSDALYTLPAYDVLVDTDNYSTAGKGGAAGLQAGTALTTARGASPAEASAQTAGLYLYYVDSDGNGIYQPKSYTGANDVLVARRLVAAGPIPALFFNPATDLIVYAGEDYDFLLQNPEGADAAAAFMAALVAALPAHPLVRFEVTDNLRYHDTGVAAAYEQGRALFLSHDNVYSLPEWEWSFQVNTARKISRYNSTAPAPYNDYRHAMAAVVGLDLANSGAEDVKLSSLTVRFRSVANFTRSDLRPLASDESSGVQLWRDADGDGAFDPQVDLRVPLSAAPAWGNDGTYDFVTFGPAALNQISGRMVDDISDFFVVVIPSSGANNTLKTNDGDQFRVDIRNADVVLNKDQNSTAQVASGIITIDSKAPELLPNGAQTADANRDGSIDTLTLFFDEPLLPALALNTAMWQLVDADTSAPVTVTAASLDATLTILTLTLDTHGLPATAPLSLITAYVDRQSALQDWYGNAVDFRLNPAGTAWIASADLVAPRVLHSGVRVSTALYDANLHIRPLTNLYFRDRNNDGIWNPGENIWQGTPVFDAQARKVWNGGFAWTTGTGYAQGVQLTGVLFCDADLNGGWSPQEFIWIDGNGDGQYQAATDVAIPLNRTEEVALLDSNRDGRLDAVAVTFSERVKDSTFFGYSPNLDSYLAGKWALTGRTNLKANKNGLPGLPDTTNNSTVLFSFDPVAAGQTDTGTMPANLTVATGESLSDFAGNLLNGGNAYDTTTQIIRLADQAPPVLLSVTSSGKVDNDGNLAAGTVLTLTFSEALVYHATLAAQIVDDFIWIDPGFGNQPLPETWTLAWNPARPQEVTLTLDSAASGLATEGIRLGINADPTRDTALADAVGHNVIAATLGLPIIGLDAADPILIVSPADQFFLPGIAGDSIAIELDLRELDLPGVTWNATIVGTASGPLWSAAHDDAIPAWTQLGSVITDSAILTVPDTYTLTFTATATVGATPVTQTATAVFYFSTAMVEAGAVVNDGSSYDIDRVPVGSTEVTANWPDFALASGTLPPANSYHILLMTGTPIAPTLAYGPFWVPAAATGNTSFTVPTAALVEGEAYFFMAGAYLATTEAGAFLETPLATAYSDGFTVVALPPVYPEAWHSYGGLALHNPPLETLPVFTSNSATTLAAHWDIVPGATGYKYRITKSSENTLWQLGSPLSTGRSKFATVEVDGDNNPANGNENIWLIGGRDGTSTYASVEVYDVTTGLWTTGASLAMRKARSEFTSLKLRDGRLLAIGGRDAALQPMTSVELYTPGTGWQEIVNLPAARYHAAAGELSDGSVLVVGGVNADGSPRNDSVIISMSPFSATAGPAGLLTSNRRFFQSVVQSRADDNDYLVIAGGEEPAGANYYSSQRVDVIKLDVNDLNTTLSLDMAQGRSEFVLCKDETQNVFFLGGWSRTAGGAVTLNSVECLDVELDIIRACAAMPLASRRGAAIYLASENAVLLSGGYGPTGTTLRATQIYDISADAWRAGQPLASHANFGRTEHMMSLVRDRIVVFGGTIGGTYTTLVEQRSDLEVVRDWQDTTAANEVGGYLSVTEEGLSLVNGFRYLFQIRAFSVAGEALVMATNPIEIDTEEVTALITAGLPVDGTTTARRSFSVTVGGAGVAQYKWSIDGGGYSDWLNVSTPITLTGLLSDPAGAAHTLRLIGRTAAGKEQNALAATTRTWTVIDPNAAITGGLPAANGSSYATAYAVTIGGTGIDAYKWRLNRRNLDGSGVVNGTWSAATPIANPVNLSGLISGRIYTFEVVGGMQTGTEWQNQATPTSRTWTTLVSTITLEFRDISDDVIPAASLACFPSTGLRFVVGDSDITSFRYTWQKTGGPLQSFGSQADPFITATANPVDLDAPLWDGPGTYTLSVYGRSNASGQWLPTPKTQVINLVWTTLASQPAATTTATTVDVLLNPVGLEGFTWKLANSNGNETTGEGVYAPSGNTTLSFTGLDIGRHTLELWGYVTLGGVRYLQPLTSPTIALFAVVNASPVGFRLSGTLDAPAYHAVAAGACQVGLTFSEELMFAPKPADFTVGNAAVTAVTPVGGDALSYTLTVVPQPLPAGTNAMTVTLSLAAGKVFALSSGNANAAVPTAQTVVYADPILTLIAQPVDAAGEPLTQIAVGEEFDVRILAANAPGDNTLFRGGDFNLAYDIAKFSLVGPLTAGLELDSFNAINASYRIQTIGTWTALTGLIEALGGALNVSVNPADLERDADGRIIYAVLRFKAEAAAVAGADFVLGDGTAVYSSGLLFGDRLLRADNADGALEYANGSLATILVESVLTMALTADSFTKGATASDTAALQLTLTLDRALAADLEVTLNLPAGVTVDGPSVIIPAGDVSLPVALTLDLDNTGLISGDISQTISVTSTDSALVDASGASVDFTILDGNAAQLLLTLPETIVEPPLAGPAAPLVLTFAPELGYALDGAGVLGLTLALTPGTAVLGADYLPTGTQLSGAGSLTLANVYGDGEFTPDKTFTVALSGLKINGRPLSLLTFAPVAVSITNVNRYPGDVDGDGVVGFEDLTLLIQFYMNPYPPCDFNNNGVVDYNDLMLLLTYYNTSYLTRSGAPVARRGAAGAPGADPTLTFTLVERSGRQQVNLGEQVTVDLYARVDNTASGFGALTANLGYDNGLASFLVPSPLSAAVKAPFNGLAGSEAHDPDAGSITELVGWSLAGIGSGTNVLFASFTFTAEQAGTMDFTAHAVSAATMGQSGTPGVSLALGTLQYAGDPQLTIDVLPPAFAVDLTVAVQDPDSNETLAETQLAFGTQAGAGIAYSAAEGDAEAAAPAAGISAFFDAVEREQSRELSRDIRGLDSASWTWSLVLDVEAGRRLLVDWSGSVATFQDGYDYWLDIGQGARIDLRSGSHSVTLAAQPTALVYNFSFVVSARETVPGSTAVFSYLLQPGWNLIGVPFTPDLRSQDILAALALQYDANAFTEGLFFSAGEACWLFVDEIDLNSAGVCPLTLTGTPAEAAGTELSPGWNLVTPLYDGNGISVPQPSLLDVPFLWQWTAAGYRPLAAHEPLLSGKGYWLYNATGATMILPKP